MTEQKTPALRDTPVIRTQYLSNGDCFQVKDYYDNEQLLKPIEDILVGLINYHWDNHKDGQADWEHWRKHHAPKNVNVIKSGTRIDFVFDEGMILIDEYNQVCLQVGNLEIKQPYDFGKRLESICAPALKSFAEYGQKEAIKPRKKGESEMNEEEKKDERFVIFTPKDINNFRAMCFSMNTIVKWYNDSFPEEDNDDESDIIKQFMDAGHLGLGSPGRWKATMVESLEIDGQCILSGSLIIQMTQEDVDGVSDDDWEEHWRDVRSNVDTEQLADNMSQLFEEYIAVERERNND